MGNLFFAAKIKRRDCMTKTTETPDAPRKPDGILTTRINNQTFITEIFFNHDSNDTFQDKLLKVIATEETT